MSTYIDRKTEQENLFAFLLVSFPSKRGKAFFLEYDRGMESI
jgi:hypothetical protein